MKAMIAVALCVFLVVGTVPASADFKYTDTSKITGGTLKSMMKAVTIFSKQASEAMKPVTTTRYIKGNRLRTDNSDGKIQIIDLDGRRVIDLDSLKHTYSEATFNEIQAAIQKSQEQAQQKMKQDPKAMDAKAQFKVKIYVTPVTTTRQIQGATANESKVEIDLEVQAQDSQASSQAGQPVSGTIATRIDSWVAPSVIGYKEIGQFYIRLAKEINWVPPSNIHIDPRVSQSMQEVQKNQATADGLPLLEYVSMSMLAQQGAPSSTAQDSKNQTSSSSTDAPPTSASDAVIKGFGGLFGKKKKKEEATPAESNSKNPPPPPSDPNSLIEMTIEVTSFSDAALDSSLFEIPEGYIRVQSDLDQTINKQPKK